MALAGLWESWRPEDGATGDARCTCAIVTTAADGFLADLHPREGPELITPAGR